MSAVEPSPLLRPEKEVSELDVELEVSLGEIVLFG